MTTGDMVKWTGHWEKPGSQRSDQTTKRFLWWSTSRIQWINQHGISPTWQPRQVSDELRSFSLCLRWGFPLATSRHQLFCWTLVGSLLNISVGHFCWSCAFFRLRFHVRCGAKRTQFPKELWSLFQSQTMQCEYLTWSAIQRFGACSDQLM